MFRCDVRIYLLITQNRGALTRTILSVSIEGLYKSICLYLIHRRQLCFRALWIRPLGIFFFCSQREWLLVSASYFDHFFYWFYCAFCFSSKLGGVWVTYFASFCKCHPSVQRAQNLFQCLTSFTADASNLFLHADELTLRTIRNVCVFCRLH